ncbi:repressor LexA [Verrucomicrobia bacterium LW23]|nr:repressor LexA [Verrucomicrobia bacterium LW23]
MALTARQQEIIDFITHYRQQQGIPPSRREIQKHFGFKSVAAVAGHLRLIEQKGALTRTSGIARGLRLTNDINTELGSIPIYGAIPAGPSSPQTQSDEGCVRVDLESLGLPKGIRTFALRVRGDSMINAGILDKDIVILEFKAPFDGAIVAALVDGETTLKRYVVQNNKPYLKAENPRHRNILPAQELIVQGVMVALLRKES